MKLNQIVQLVTLILEMPALNPGWFNSCFPWFCPSPFGKITVYLHTFQIRSFASHPTIPCHVVKTTCHAVLQSGTYLHTESTYTHQTLCCRITILTFTFLTNFKISNVNKEHISSLKMI